MSQKTKAPKPRKYWKTHGGRILLRMGLIIGFLQAIASIGFFLQIQAIGMFPGSYRLAIGLILAGTTLMTFLLQYKKGPGIFGKICGIIMIILMLLGIRYIYSTQKALEDITGATTETNTVGIYVRNKSSYESLDDLKGVTCGYISDDENENDKAILAAVDEKNLKLEYRTADNAQELADMLLDKTVEAAVLDPTYVDILAESGEYDDIKDKIRLIETIQYDTESEEPVKLPFLSSSGELDKDTITVYISGSDTRDESVNNSRSDVNIILSMNTKTHEVLLLNTPRDYYVSLSIAGGAKDKLTHAGLYGTKVSMNTLEKLYDTEIDYYAKLSFEGFESIIDALGGIDIELDYSGTLTQTMPGGLTVHKGTNHFNGAQALAFARERYFYEEGDDQRGRNQMMVIEAIFAKMSSASMLTNYTEVLKAATDSVITDMPYKVLAALVNLELYQRPNWHIQTFSVTGDDASKTTYSMPNAKAYVTIPDMDTVEEAQGYLDDIEEGKVPNVPKNDGPTLLN